MTPEPPARVFLAGFMGCGKTTVAPILARLLGLGWIDLDAEIERRTGRSISGIFAGEGERRFREIERGLLAEAASRSRVVVALGGGTIATEANLALVRSAGVLVYLAVDFETLFARLRTKRDRPLLGAPGAGSAGAEALRDTMRRLLAEREPFYRRAHIVLAPGTDDPARTAAQIADAIERAGPAGPT